MPDVSISDAAVKFQNNTGDFLSPSSTSAWVIHGTFSDKALLSAFKDLWLLHNMTLDAGRACLQWHNRPPDTRRAGTRGQTCSTGQRFRQAAPHSSPVHSKCSPRAILI